MDRLRVWLTDHGGAFHPAVVLKPQGPFGVSVLAPRFSEDTTVVTCPISLVITQDASLLALRSILGPDAHASLEGWSERQLICSYLSFHQLCLEGPSSPEVLQHFPYFHCLPSAATLSTPLYFTTAEREVLRGTNLHGATLDRERDWRAEWAQCQSLVHTVRPAWGDAFTWDMYLAASTHLSSRAFPSSILSSTPSLVSTPSAYPVLIPGVDLLNHKRGRPVSWIVSCQEHDATVSIVVHPEHDTDVDTADALVELFNNYGPKPNDELILGYGFALPDNPDDTITLRVGGAGAPSQPWVVGRHARHVDGLWSDVRRMVGESEYDFEDDLETAAVLSDMVRAKLEGMMTVADVRRHDALRPAVKRMLEHYIAGQRDILESILGFLDEKRQAAIETAREQGIDIMFSGSYTMHRNKLLMDGDGVQVSKRHGPHSVGIPTKTR